jgi:hypothetical protein
MTGKSKKRKPEFRRLRDNAEPWLLIAPGHTASHRRMLALPCIESQRLALAVPVFHLPSCARTMMRSVPENGTMSVKLRDRVVSDIP